MASGTIAGLTMLLVLGPAQAKGDMPQDTRTGERVTITNPAPSQDPQAGDWRLVEELRIGVVEGSGADALGKVADLTVDDSGRIFVLDFGSREVRVFDRDGQFVRSMAPEGDGPGERRYRNVSGQAIVWQSPNRLWLGDGTVQLVLDTLGNELGRSVPGRNQAVAGQLPTRSTILGADSADFVYGEILVAFMMNPSARDIPLHTSVAYFPLSDEHEILPGDTLLIEVGHMTHGDPALVTTSGGRAELTVRHARPASPRQYVVGYGAGTTVWLAHKSQYRFSEVTFAGDTIRTVAFDGSRSFQIAALDVSPEGWLWIRRELRERGPAAGMTTWDVVDNCGRYRGTASVEYPVHTVHVGGGGRLYGVTSDALDVDRVLRFRLQNTSSGERIVAESCSSSPSG